MVNINSDLLVEQTACGVYTRNRYAGRSGFGRYDVMLTPIVNVLSQIEEKQYATELAAKGFTPERNLKK